MAQIGIDLGTTNSVAAVCVKGQPEVILSREHERHFPSIVAPRKGGLLVGSPGMARPEAFSSVKRFIGRRIDDDVVVKAREKGNLGYEIVADPDDEGQLKVKLGEVALTPIEVAAEILRKIKLDAEASLGEPVTHAVITVPAYFYDNQRVATRQAGAMAGLTVMQILHEPTAAALAFGRDQRSDDDRGVRRILVYDLGGGTFDVSLITLADGIPMVDTVEGDPFCGGDDFDYAIMDYVLGQLDAKYPGKRDALRRHTRFMHGLKRRAEQAKFALSQASSADVEWLDAPRIEDEEIEVEVSIQRADFERWVRPQIERTLSLVHKALETAELNPSDIDDVLLVGGSTSVPLIRKLLGEAFGKDKLRMHVNPMECVARGAALRASEQKKLICPRCDHPNDEGEMRCRHCEVALTFASESLICPRCSRENPMDAAVCSECDHAFAAAAEGRTAMPYGISLHGGEFGLLVPKGTAVPTHQPFEQEFTTSHDGQRSLLIEVCEGAAPRASENQLVGCVVVPIPEHARGPLGLRARIGLNLDRDGILTVTVRGLGPLSGVEIEARLERGKKLRLCPTCGEPNGDLERCAHCSASLGQEVKRDNVCPKPDCREGNAPGEQVCRRCGTRLQSGKPEWMRLVELASIVMGVARVQCGWFLSPEQRQFADQLERDADRALAERDEATGIKAVERCRFELEGGTFAGVSDLIWAEVHAHNHSSAEKRAHMGALLSRFRHAWDVDRDRGLQLRRDLNAAMADGAHEDGARGENLDLRPKKLS